MIYDSLENVRLIRDRLKIAYSRENSYADNRRRDLEFEVGEKVYIQIPLIKGVMIYVKREKLVPGMWATMR